MKLKQSCCPLASRASHWPPVSSRGGSSDEGGGVWLFSYCLRPAEGLNLGLEQLGSSDKNTGGSLASNQHGFGPDLTPDQHHNLHVSRVVVFRSAGTCGGRAAAGGGCYMRICAWSAGEGAGLQKGIDIGNYVGSEVRGAKKMLPVGVKYTFLTVERQKIPDAYYCVEEWLQWSIWKVFQQKS